MTSHFLPSGFLICSSGGGLPAAQLHANRGHGSSAVPAAAEVEGKAEADQVFLWKTLLWLTDDRRVTYKSATANTLKILATNNLVISNTFLVLNTWTFVALRTAVEVSCLNGAMEAHRLGKASNCRLPVGMLSALWLCWMTRMTGPEPGAQH